MLCLLFLPCVSRNTCSKTRLNCVVLSKPVRSCQAWTGSGLYGHVNAWTALPPTLVSMLLVVATVSGLLQPLVRSLYFFMICKPPQKPYASLFGHRPRGEVGNHLASPNGLREIGLCCQMSETLTSLGWIISRATRQTVVNLCNEALLNTELLSSYT